MIGRGEGEEGKQEGCMLHYSFLATRLEREGTGMISKFKRIEVICMAVDLRRKETGKAWREKGSLRKEELRGKG